MSTFWTTGARKQTKHVCWKVYVHVTRRCIGCPCYFKFIECRMVSPDITQNKKLDHEKRYENSYICEVLTFSASTRRQMVKHLLNKTCLLPCGQTSDLLSVFLSCLNKWQMYSQVSPQKEDCEQWHFSWPFDVYLRQNSSKYAYSEHFLMINLSKWFINYIQRLSVVCLWFWPNHCKVVLFICLICIVS